MAGLLPSRANTLLPASISSHQQGALGLAMQANHLAIHNNPATNRLHRAVHPTRIRGLGERAGVRGGGADQVAVAEAAEAGHTQPAVLDQRLLLTVPSVAQHPGRIADVRGPSLLRGLVELHHNRVILEDVEPARPLLVHPAPLQSHPQSRLLPRFRIFLSLLCQRPRARISSFPSSRIDLILGLYGDGRTGSFDILSETYGQTFWAASVTDWQCVFLDLLLLSG
jgi:hypothetical protein